VGESSAILALVIGSVSRDLAGAGPGRPGGVVHHAGCALARLGAVTRVVTRVAGPDGSLLQPLRALGVELRALPSARTTTYRNDYSGGVDRHELLACSDPIGPDDVPPEWRRADLVQLGPLHPRDLRPGLALRLRGLIGLDVQGLVRGDQPPPGPHPPPWAGHLEGVTIVKAGEVELAALLRGSSPREFLAHSGCAELVVTRGPQGARILTAHEELEVPAAAAVARDLVGAGDVFLASYLLARAQGRTPAQAGRLAARASAAKIEERELTRAQWAGEDGA
jgi:sugar/nucleoside kinase (ribokinase family)